VTANQLRGGATLRAASVQSVQTYARIAGVLFLVSLVVGGFGEAYAPSRIVVPGDASATAHNLLASDLLFRLGFLAYLAEAVCDVALTLLLYVLLRPVQANLALLAVFFRLLGTATFAFGELFYFAASLILGGEGYLTTFSPDQRNVLALLSINLYYAAFNLFTIFGVASILLGYLMARLGYLPRVLGALWVLGGLGFVTNSVVFVLAPASVSSLLLVPNGLAVLSLGLWLLVKGVDVTKWNERGAVVEYGSVPSEHTMSPAL